MVLNIGSLGSFSTLALALCLGGVAYVAFAVVRNLYFHPLSNVPGPKCAAISNLWYSWRYLGGRLPYHLLDLHKKYGPMVRVAPNEVSFNSAQAWKDIYDFGKGKRCLIKGDFYDGGTFTGLCGSIISERDPDTHAQMRRYLSHAFSQRSLVEQEDIVAGLIDQFIAQMERKAHSGEVVDMSEWFNLMTFDIIGDLALGESFGGISSGKLHPWIARIIGTLKQGAMADTMRRFPAVGAAAFRLFPGMIQKIILNCKINEQYCIDYVEKRIAKRNDRKDFLTRILEHRDEDNISVVQIAAHSADFVTAGSETTATALCAITYYLLKYPEVAKKLIAEIRGAFKSYDEINFLNTTPLEYLNAVCLEGMRMYPPVPFGLPRLTSPEGDIIDGHFLPGGVTVAVNTTASCLDPANFTNPLEFIPERWIGRNEKDILEASQPFSMGPRGCIGRSLAWMEMRTTFAKIHYKFDLEMVDPGLDWQRDSKMLTLWQKPKLLVRFKTRA